MNHQGQTVTSSDDEGTVLTFNLDSQGNPLQIIDPLWNYTVMTHDVRGKRLSLLDPNAGLTTSTYDAKGQVLTQTNAKAETITYVYDVLGRVRQRISPEGTQTWTYDTAPHGKGKIAYIEGLNSYREDFSYDVLGRPTQTKKRIGGKDYISGQSYDSLSRLDVMRYPSGLEIEHFYTARGDLSEIKRVDTNSVLLRIDTINAKGQLEQKTLGNGLITSKTYDSET
ncbi:MAG: hypothetical protein SGJ02_01245 [bacterium]|nr:hypothetical protein [bacterium]